MQSVVNNFLNKFSKKKFLFDFEMDVLEEEENFTVDFFTEDLETNFFEEKKFYS